MLWHCSIGRGLFLFNLLSFHAMPWSPVLSCSYLVAGSTPYEHRPRHHKPGLCIQMPHSRPAISTEVYRMAVHI